VKNNNGNELLNFVTLTRSDIRADNFLVMAKIKLPN
jgi:hypothetical protein